MSAKLTADNLRDERLGSTSTKKVEIGTCLRESSYNE